MKQERMLKAVCFCKNRLGTGFSRNCGLSYLPLKQLLQRRFLKLSRCFGEAWQDWQKGEPITARETLTQHSRNLTGAELAARAGDLLKPDLFRSRRSSPDRETGVSFLCVLSLPALESAEMCLASSGFGF